jgi:O-antigen ligase
MMLARFLNEASFREKPANVLFAGFSIITLVALFAAIASGDWLPAALPLLVLLIFITIVDFRKTFYLLLFTIPLSTEIVFPGGFGTDLPTEPLMVGLMLVFLLFLFRHPNALLPGFLKHPITLLLLLHWAWTLIPLLYSTDILISIKFFAAKSWYVITFFFLTGYMIKGVEQLKKLFWIIFIPLMITVVVILIRHAGYGFSFADVYRVLSPFYRNHVSYAAIMAVFFPFVWYARTWYPSASTKRVLILISLLVLLIAIQLSFTRAAMGAVVLSAGAFLVIHFRLVKPAIVIALVVAAGLVGWLASGNNYLNFSPNYERTVSHHRFDNLLQATYQGEDISTMERFYRWIAGFNMVSEKPWTGFGPGNFLEQYKSYTVNSFRTYVSHNPEQSGIHCYYLMLAVEQGIPGLFFFVLPLIVALIMGEQAYHRFKHPEHKQAVMISMLSLIIILILCVINDLIETDKIGSFFFMSLALLVNFDLLSKKEKSAHA